MRIHCAGSKRFNFRNGDSGVATALRMRAKCGICGNIIPFYFLFFCVFDVCDVCYVRMMRVHNKRLVWTRFTSYSPAICRQKALFLLFFFVYTYFYVGLASVQWSYLMWDDIFGAVMRHMNDWRKKYGNNFCLEAFSWAFYQSSIISGNWAASPVSTTDRWSTNFLLFWFLEGAMQKRWIYNYVKWIYQWIAM